MQVIFLFRRINDFDQFYPIIYFFKKKFFKIKIEAICTNPNLDLSILKKYNVDKEIVKVSSVNNFFFYYKVVSFFIKFFFFFKFNNFKLNLKKKFVRYISIKINSKWEQKIASFKPRLVVLDYPAKLNYGLEHLLKICRANKIKILGIHHGVWIRLINYKNQKDERTLNQIKTQSYEKKFSIYDWIVVSNRYHRRLIYTYNKKSISEKRIVCLGSLRFTSMWTKNYKKDFNSNNLINNSKKINILYMDHSKIHGLDGKKIFNGILKLIKLKYVNLVIQPNTSNVYEKPNFDYYDNYNLSSDELKKFKSFFSNESTIDLISKSDIIINTISSAAIEAILQNKIIIYPKHWHTNLTYYEKFKSCNLFTNDEEMIYYINNLNVTKNLQISDNLKKNYKKFLKFTVHNNLSENECINKYCNFILNIM